MVSRSRRPIDVAHENRDYLFKLPHNILNQNEFIAPSAKAPLLSLPSEILCMILEFLYYPEYGDVANDFDSPICFALTCKAIAKLAVDSGVENPVAWAPARELDHNESYPTEELMMLFSGGWNRDHDLQICNATSQFATKSPNYDSSAPFWKVHDDYGKICAHCRHVILRTLEIIRDSLKERIQLDFAGGNLRAASLRVFGDTASNEWDHALESAYEEEKRAGRKIVRINEHYLRSYL